MKATFVTSKSSEQAFRDDLAPFQTKGHVSLEIRDHVKDENLIVIILSSRMDQIQDNFRRYLKMREAQKMIRSLNIHEIDGMGYATKNGVRETTNA